MLASIPFMNPGGARSIFLRIAGEQGCRRLVGMLLPHFREALQPCRRPGPGGSQF